MEANLDYINRPTLSLREFLESYDSYEDFLENLKEHPNLEGNLNTFFERYGEDNTHHMEEAILDAFPWSISKEGFDYWANLGSVWRHNCSLSKKVELGFSKEDVLERI